MIAFVAALAVGVFVAAAVAFVFGVDLEHLVRSVLPDRWSQPERQQRLRSGEPHLRPMQRLAASLLSGLVAFAVLSLFTGSPAIAIPVAAACGLGLPTIYHDRRHRAWRQRQLQAWPEAIRELVSGMLSARSLHQALVDLSVSGPEQLRPMWRQYAVLAQSLDSRQALEAVRDELADPVTDRVVEILIVAFDAGPAVMMEILRELADSISDDIHLARRIDVANTEERITVWLTLLLPMAMLLVLIVLAGGDFRAFYETTAGLVVVGIGTALSVVSYALVSRLASLTEEPRLFGGDPRG